VGSGSSEPEEKKQIERKFCAAGGAGGN